MEPCPRLVFILATSGIHPNQETSCCPMVASIRRVSSPPSVRGTEFFSPTNLASVPLLCAMDPGPLVAFARNSLPLVAYYRGYLYPTTHPDHSAPLTALNDILGEDGCNPRRVSLLQTAGCWVGSRLPSSPASHAFLRHVTI